MIHTASLVHDDVLDDCSVRRGARPVQRFRLLVWGPPALRVGLTRQRGCAGKTTVNSLYGSRVAVLVGDYLFAQSSWYLANLDNLEVRAYCVWQYKVLYDLNMLAYGNCAGRRLSSSSARSSQTLRTARSARRPRFSTPTSRCSSTWTSRSIRLPR